MYETADRKPEKRQPCSVPAWMSEGAARYADPFRRRKHARIARRPNWSVRALGSSNRNRCGGVGSWSGPVADHGLPTIANVLYMTRITRSPENGFWLATGSYLQTWLRRRGTTICGARPRDMTSIAGIRIEAVLRQARRTAARTSLRLKNGTSTPSLCLPPTAPSGPSPPTNAQLRGHSGGGLWKPLQPFSARSGLEDDDPPRLAWHPEGKTGHDGA